MGQDEAASSSVVVQPANQNGQIPCRWCGLFSDPGPACDLCGSPLLDVPWLQVPQLLYKPESVESPQIVAPSAPPEPAVAAAAAAQAAPPAAPPEAPPEEPQSRRRMFRRPTERPADRSEVAEPVDDQVVEEDRVAEPVAWIEPDEAQTEEAQRRALLGRLWPRKHEPEPEDEPTAVEIRQEPALDWAAAAQDEPPSVPEQPSAELEESPAQPKPRWWRRARKDSAPDGESLAEAAGEASPDADQQVPLPPAAGDAPAPHEARASGGEKRSTVESVESQADLESEAARKEEARLRAEEEARLKAEEEARLKAEEEARLRAEEEARFRAEEEARLQAEEEARLRAEEEDRLQAEEEARLKAEEEARLKAEKEARVKAKEKARRAEEEARLRAEEVARLRAEEEARLRAEEVARLKAEEEARLRAQEEARLKAQEEARLRAEEEARLKAEEAARIRAEEEARLRAEEEARVRAEQKAATQKPAGEEALRADLMREMLGLGSSRGARQAPAPAPEASPSPVTPPPWSSPAAPTPAEAPAAAWSGPVSAPEPEEKKRSKLMPWKKGKRKRGEAEGVAASTARYPATAVPSSNGLAQGAAHPNDPALAGPGAVFLTCSRCGQPSPGGGLCEACEDALSQLRQLTAEMFQLGE